MTVHKGGVKRIYNTTGKTNGMSMDSIAELLGVSRQRVEQILSGAMRKLRKEMKLNGYTFEDFQCLLNHHEKDHTYSLTEGRE